MVFKKRGNILIWLFAFIVTGLFISSIASCGKQGGASPTGLNIQYEILNLSPDLFPVDLYIKFVRVNPITQPFVFESNQVYFYVPFVDTPYQIRTHSVSNI